ncbi:ZntA Cation transport ATPase [Pyrenophora tritici-repentis]|uniref:P-type Cu(+) transporter n=2 Tax=Pyrenophora tritici-repentis TaxID=45151 RepID=A0A2W1DAI6_9PLEO|nr:copper-transporting ATPase 2 [Pyrenophora tritici-repentis Pt-1C-BFP]KAA8612448.1 copper-transporting atpase [Pyrenophora tritici-repentis]EDU47684.1 copper-transporting ATPase 2 [Pyrenophora tritici-repentis Pt-1C-BFP]KAF7447026.1 copper-transporting atpase [Pyrenophora tritici-repentis]KAF7569317.1 ZntA, Cation transport ATPase [Pyrenophora tritici-repentis]KAG9382911.1 copper-transporting atpase [Pyrenophora tritici-repentis]
MAPPTTTTTAHMATTTLKVEGMTCGACTSAIESGFQGVKGVGNVSISLVMERAVVQHDPDLITADEVREIIEDRGFDAEVLSSDLPLPHPDDHFLSDSEDEEETIGSIATTTLSVGGMTCGACTSAVEGAFKDVAGLKSFSISLLSERAVIEHDTTIITAEQLAETIEDVGFDAKVLDTAVATTGPKKSKSRKQQKTMTTTVAVEGMTCGACTSAIESGFKDVDGVYQFNISLLANRAVLVHDPAKLTEDQIVEIIEDRGFDAKVLSSVDGNIQHLSANNAPVQLKIYGLPNENAAAELEGLLRKRPGITSATVKFSNSRATIQREPQIIGLRAIVEAVEAAGYNALVADSEDNDAQLESLAKTKEIQEWRRAVVFSAWFAVPVFLTSMFIPMFLPFLNYGGIRIIPGLYLGDVICFFLTIPVQFGIGKRFYVSAYKSLSHGAPTMDVLVVLGTSSAFFFSVFSMLVSLLVSPHTKPTTLFDTSTMLITFISLGRYLENKAKGQTSKALSNLMSLAPSMTTIYADPIAAAKAAEGWDVAEEKLDRKSIDGNAVEERVISTELIEVGDVVILRPGDKLPADGTVTRGESYLNESMVTGEAMPILKKKGSLVMAGTVNGAGRLEFVVTRAGRDTQLSQIVRLVQEAQTSRAPIQRLADTVAGYFVPIIITLGLATFIGWMVLSHILPYPPKVFLDHASGGKFMVCIKLCIAVIVFACPCALGLATPTAVMVGTGVGAEQGILVKGGAALETATKINHVIFDKTGTLTVGKMSVSKADIQGEWAKGEKKKLWWTLIGLAEMGSEHPIAKAIVLSAKDHLRLGPDGSFDGAVGDFEAIVGKGITATVEAAMSRERTRYKVLIGNTTFLTSEGVNVPHFVEETSASTNANSRGRSAGITTIHTAIGNTYTGTLSLSDTIKPSARAAVLALSRLGISSSIVTGDTSASALVVAAAVGIDAADVHASSTPADKKAMVEDLQSRGMVVGMVGDGINDSPALAAADIGIALSSGTDVAMEAASIVLMTNTDLLAIPASLVLSRAIFFRIKLNLAWACMYNFVGLPFAMGFFLPWGLSLHPMAAGAAMACSSVSVVASSLHLKFWTRPSWMKVSVLDPNAPIDDREAEMEKLGGKGMFSTIKDWVSDAWAARKRNKEETSYMPLRDMGDH